MSKEDKVRWTVKVGDELIEILKDEQHQRRKKTGVEPTYEEILWDWKQRAELAEENVAHSNPDQNATSAVASTGKLTYNALAGVGKLEGWYALLQRILQSGHNVAINAITHNLFAFDLLISATQEQKSRDIELPSLDEVRQTLSPNTAAAYEEYLRATGRLGDGDGEPQEGSGLRRHHRTG